MVSRAPFEACHNLRLTHVLPETRSAFSDYKTPPPKKKLPFRSDFALGWRSAPGFEQPRVSLCSC